jgi:hypothetical protein
MTTGPEDTAGVGASGDQHLRYRGGWWWTTGRRDFPWLGAFLIAIGGALAVAQAAPGVDDARLIAAFLGLAFWAAFFAASMGWAGIVAAILGGWGLSGILQDLGYVSGTGWTPLLIGAGFLVVYLGELALRGGRLGWTLWIGLALVVLGAFDIALRQIPGIPPLDALVVPVILIAIGAFLVLRAIRRP